MIWYIGSLVGYGLMENFSQGLHIKSSRDMFLFTASESLFMVSMAMSSFFSWQTYTPVDDQIETEYNELEVIPVEFRESAQSFVF